jgi:hypothetical protein
MGASEGEGAVVGSLSTGGGSSAVAASAHAGCQRFRHTDPLVIGMSRRKLADQLGKPDSSAGIPEARWMRAMTFERLVRHERFVSQLLATAVGALQLDRPQAVRRVDCGVVVANTAAAIQQAHLKAVHESAATMLTGLAVPFVGMEADQSATPVKPDFAIVAPRPASGSTWTAGSWLIMGDAKDYERVRSRIDDPRMLKGFLQVALGAESAEAWSEIPDGMIVHRWGALAVPRNAFLQPEAIVEDLADHRREVRGRVDERTQLLADVEAGTVATSDSSAFVGHLVASFDPGSCRSCPLFNFCRSEIRESLDPHSLLVELGVRPEQRAAVVGLIDGTGGAATAPKSLVASISASIDGLPRWTGQRRTDPVGSRGAINVVLAKSDSAALGIHGIGIQRIGSKGKPSKWTFTVFDEPQSPQTRLDVLEIFGVQINAAMADLRTVSVIEPPPLHIVTPDNVTADVLVSIADSLAGVELSRIRWQRDLDMGREALTFDGEPATVPSPLSESQRLSVSFLLEDDRARAMSLRRPLVNLRSILAQHVVPGGPPIDAGRLDYLVEWAEATKPLDHRVVSDDIEARTHTPGARLSNANSNAIHGASKGGRRDKSATAQLDLRHYRKLVTEELAYKAAYVDRATAVLHKLPLSRLEEVHSALEASAQVVWRTRLQLHAFDLVRFGRTSWVWRNDHVELLDADASCATKLSALGNPQAAMDLALDAGTREVALAEVVGVRPYRLKIRSRRIIDGATAVLLQVNGTPCIEDNSVFLTIQKGSFKFGGLALGPLSADANTSRDNALSWDPKIDPCLSVGDEVVVANATWFGDLKKSGHEINIDRPAADTSSAPKSSCFDGAYASDPDGHLWCCRPHEIAEADWSDELALRRERGELNPQTWPPIIDEDQFDTPPAGSPTDDATAVGGDPVPADLTLDDLGG